MPSGTAHGGVLQPSANHVLVIGSTRMENSEMNRTANGGGGLLPVTPQISALCTGGIRRRITDRYQPRPLHVRDVYEDPSLPGSGAQSRPATPDNGTTCGGRHSTRHDPQPYKDQAFLIIRNSDGTPFSTVAAQDVARYFFSKGRGQGWTQYDPKEGQHW